MARPVVCPAGGVGVQGEGAGCWQRRRGWGASISAEARVIGSSDSESQGSGARALPPLAPKARGMVSEESVAHFGYLSRYTILPARAKEGPLGSGRSQPLCNQCSPDLIPRRTHPTRIRGPGRDTSRPQRRPGPGRTADAGAERIPRTGGSPAEPARGWEECKVPFLAGKVRAGVRGGTGVKKQREEQRQGIRDVTPSKKRSDKGVKDRETVPQTETETQKHRT